MRAQLTLAASYRPADGEPVAAHLDAIALRWAERLGRPVARQEVIKALLEAGLKEHPVSDEELQNARAKGRVGRPIERPARPKLTLATVDGQRLLVEEGKGRGDAGRANRKDRKHAVAA